MTTQTKDTRIPTPVYAAAGVGDLAYRTLRQLPDLLSDLSGKAVVTGAELRAKAETLRTTRLTPEELRQRAAATTADLREKATATVRAANSVAAGLRGRAGELDLDRLRALALRNAAVVVAGAQAAQERAMSVYDALVTRGEQVIGGGVGQAADLVDEDLATTAPAEVAPAAAVPVDAVPATEVGAPTAEHALTAETTGPATPKVEETKPAVRPTKPTAKATQPAATRVTRAAKAKAANVPARPVKRTRPAAE